MKKKYAVAVAYDTFENTLKVHIVEVEGGWFEALKAVDPELAGKIVGISDIAEAQQVAFDQGWQFTVKEIV